MDTWKAMYGQAAIQKTRYPGVWRRKEGGHFIRARAKDPASGSLREVRRVLAREEAADALVASRILEAELAAVRAGPQQPQAERPTFGTYALSLLKRRIERGKVKSESSLEGWKTKLSHLLEPFGTVPVDQIRRADVEAWWSAVGQRVARGEVAPRTANGWLGKLQQITKAAAAEYELPRDPAAGVEPIEAPAVYTVEEPNSLTTAELPVFLRAWRARYPQHFVFVLLGFATGQRPSHLRPLRRKGPQADVLWEQGLILIRRSHSLKQAVMERTKTKKNQAIRVGPTMLQVLKDHAATLPEDSDLLFPGAKGGLMCVRALTNMWGRVAKAAGIQKKITGRAMRRTFQDLAREAGVSEFVAQSICGHVTQEMTWLYSTPQAQEQEAAIDRLIGLMLPAGGVDGGVNGGEVRPN